MKPYLAAILLALIAHSAYAEPRQKTIQFMCGSKEEWFMTADKYGEELVLATPAPNSETIISLWVNFNTGTSSWITQVIQTDEWCMMGIGQQLMIPKDSPLNSTIGTKVNYK
jgi:hypothetical protein